MSDTSTQAGPGVQATGRSNGMAIAALVCGIVGLFIFEVILGVLAIIFGAIGLSRANRGAGRRGLAWAGVILGVIDVVLFVVILAVSAKHHLRLFI
jgi:Domain of unknown function (DUF4190)